MTSKRTKRKPLPPVPPAPSIARPASLEPSAPPSTLVDLGDPPMDTLEGQDFAYRALLLSLHDVMRDDKISPRERRKEMRTIAAAIARLMPRARLYRAEQLVLTHMAKLDVKASAKRGAKVEPLPRKVESDAR